MKTNSETKTHNGASRSRTFAKVCLASCQKLVTEIEKVKEVLLDEFPGMRETHEQLLRLALTEAEALAWQTEFPHLVFPMLAREKVQTLAGWNARQQSIQRIRLAQPVAA